MMNMRTSQARHMVLAILVGLAGAIVAFALVNFGDRL